MIHKIMLPKLKVPKNINIFCPCIALIVELWYNILVITAMLGIAFMEVHNYGELLQVRYSV